MTLTVALTLIGLAPQEPPFHLESVAGTRVTVNAFPSGTESGYPFTVTARPDGSLPVLQRNYVTSGRIQVHVKLPDGRYGRFCDWGTTATRNGGGVLLPPGDYLYEYPAQDGLLLASGYYMPVAQQQKVWTLSVGGTATETLNLAGGGTFTGQRFTVAARPDGSLPYVKDRCIPGSALIYRRQASGSYTIWSKHLPVNGPGILLTAGEYAIPASAPAAGSPGDFTLCYMGEWVMP